MSVSMPEKHIVKAIARFESCTRKPVVRTDFGRVSKIITLSRDYGTDGRAIGEMVAKKLGLQPVGPRNTGCAGGPVGLETAGAHVRVT